MADFHISFKITGGNEGGFANDPNDPGGKTYAGIAFNYWPNWKGWSYVDAAVHQYGKDTGKIDAILRANGVVEQLVIDFYKANFWNVCQLDQMNDQRVADTLYDCSVNQGINEAKHILQESCNELSAQKIAVDGKIGPATLALANVLNGKVLYDQINKLRLASYKLDKGFAKYGKTWAARLTAY